VPPASSSRSKSKSKSKRTETDDEFCRRKCRHYERMADELVAAKKERNSLRELEVC
jgi:hypothetical protein